MQLGINFKISNTRSKSSQRPKGNKVKTTRKANTLIPILLTSKRTYQGPLESKTQEKKRQHKHDIQKTPPSPALQICPPLNPFPCWALRDDERKEKEHRERMTGRRRRRRKGGGDCPQKEEEEKNKKYVKRMNKVIHLLISI
ncbi:hypothetical protein M431DRAFT_291036 [Trichoderma harzianum CBS 226.95]|uniref:Uncharacterized protein n=1 Tax=Trichoderma harzianum CBS 226.95 TaxID=983964 RepID=A0A2T4APT7_TRIHA|nr:hypothetical protein M431DRAFT_291036 [Trichoderma harzianum CBS 226.95]PTB58938.1 hypothetical protein M431DRAFT_291036 [Trichoderma harzianum CBS 226.95]